MYYLLDMNLNAIAVIETIESVIWTTRYYESGDFELYMPATPKLVELMKRNYYVVRDDDYTQCMIIENIQITTDIEIGDKLIISGRSLKSILQRRIIWRQTNVNGYVEDCIRQLVSDNAINPIDEKRKIKQLKLGAKMNFDLKMSAQYTGDNLYDVITEICKNYGLGWDILLDIENGDFIFILYNGVNRSYSQAGNDYVIFSNEFENLLTTNYTNVINNYKNAALIAGEGEGILRKTQELGTTSDLERYEVFIDARDISTNDGEITIDEYNELLLERGREGLAEHTIIENIEGEVEANHTYKVNVDYFLGDIVEVINEYGISTTPRIIEIIESEDETGVYVIPTFSTE